MPRFEESQDLNDPDELARIMGTHKAHKTCQNEEQVLTKLNDFLVAQYNQDLESLVEVKNEEDLKLLEDCLVNFFNMFRKNNGDKPTKAYLDWYKSFVKMKILRLSRNQLDISDKQQFQKLNDFLQGYYKLLQLEGKTERHSYPEIPAEIEATIQKFLAYLHTLMQKSPDYDLSGVPNGYMDKLNYVAQWGLYYILASYDCVKARAGNSSLTKSHFQKYEENGIEFYKKVKGEDSEETDETGAIIPCYEIGHGLNPGAYFESFLTKLNPDNDRIFQRPLRESRATQGRLPWIDIWFERTNVGIHTIGDFMPRLTKALGLNKFANASIKRKNISKLGFSGYKRKSSAIDSESPSKSAKMSLDVKMEPSEEFYEEQFMDSDPLGHENSFKDTEYSVEESETNPDEPASFKYNTEEAFTHLSKVEDFVQSLTQSIETEDITEEHLIVVRELSKKIETIASQLSSAKDNLCDKLWNYS